MRIFLALGLAVALVAGTGLTAARLQSEGFAGKWEVVVDGTGPFAGTGSLDLTVDGATVNGTFTSGPRRLDVKGGISDGSLNLYFEGGYFLGVIREGALTGTHIYTIDGNSWKTGWRGKRPGTG